MVTAALPLSMTYYGHCAFLWQSPAGVRILSDPYRNRYDRYWFVRQFPRVYSDLALITHAHFDHDAAAMLPETTSVLRLPGEFRHQDVVLRGILDKHSGGASYGIPNVMFRIEMGGIRFLHLGDNAIDWSRDVAQAVGEIDVLLVTVDDSCHLLSFQEVETLVTRLQPRVVVPMHYFIRGLMPESSPLQGPEGWLATQEQVRYLESHTITLTAAQLPATTEVWVFDPAPESFAAPVITPPALPS